MTIYPGKYFSEAANLFLNIETLINNRSALTAEGNIVLSEKDNNFLVEVGEDFPEIIWLKSLKRISPEVEKDSDIHRLLFTLWNERGIPSEEAVEEYGSFLLLALSEDNLCYLDPSGDYQISKVGEIHLAKVEPYLEEWGSG